MFEATGSVQYSYDEFLRHVREAEAAWIREWIEQSNADPNFNLATNMVFNASRVRTRTLVEITPCVTG